MNRRDLFKSAFLGAGAAAGAGAPSQLVQIAPASAAAQAAAQSSEAAWKPLLLDDHQNETVIALSELIIPETDTPGAKAARVNEYIDLYLHDVADDKGRSFLLGLGWLDGYAMRLHGAPFVKLTEAQQVEILKTLDGSTGPDLQIGARFFQQAKRLTVEGYYTSKIGIDELNKEGLPASFACTHGEHA